MDGLPASYDAWRTDPDYGKSSSAIAMEERAEERASEVAGLMAAIKVKAEELEALLAKARYDEAAPPKGWDWDDIIGMVIDLKAAPETDQVQHFMDIEAEA